LDHSSDSNPALKTLAFDLDGTLCTLTNGAYELAEPFPDRIAMVNKLSQEGNKILVFTARGVTSKRDLREFTIQQLNAWGICFDELIMGKPHFDLLIDDKATSDKDFFEQS
jgi:phosphoglycolate phosphatase-like HAD superfamily hydrolase